MAKNPLLLVEGVDDAGVIGNLLSKHGIKTLFKRDPASDKADEIIIKDLGGRTELLKKLKTEIVKVETAFGIVIDADADTETSEAVEDSWKAIANRLREIGYTEIPAEPNQAGTIIPAKSLDSPTETDLPRCGIWLMPFNASSGKLENFVEGLIPPAKQKLWERATGIVREIPPDERLFAGKDDIKAQVHTFLAWQEEPGKQMGTAIGAGYLLSDTPEVQSFIAWVRKLLSLTG